MDKNNNDNDNLNNEKNRYIFEDNFNRIFSQEFYLNKFWLLLMFMLVEVFFYFFFLLFLKFDIEKYK